MSLLPRRFGGMLLVLGCTISWLPMPARAEANGTDDMLFVPGGTFAMGADAEGEQDERPRHSVEVSGFWLDRTEVTQSAYRTCVAAKACKPPASLRGSPLVNGRASEFERGDHPVVGVSWFDANDYCRFRGRRLPSEAEWERAARGDDARRFAWGNEVPDPTRHGVFGGRATTERVGSFPDGRGPYGHDDLAGNVWEWVADEYDPFAYRRASASTGQPGTCAQILATLAELRATHQQGFTGKNPIPVECERVLRGGAYNYGSAGMRASNRVHHPARFRVAVAGFRCAMDAPVTAGPG
ncbi:MAG TPA: SUMF1/EgtB/PvdO family nonheme iron enzyme [Polyangiaceae bacterium]|nr:SUMF1/EgtB/PvdO family nonheme iron enzyme [Polyangiaceae bacterium]